jgi:ATP-binding cassette subfamily D (ALD) long-chain fatty acid import protein
MLRTTHRLLQYAILDECTSAVTLDIEKVMYDYATGALLYIFFFQGAGS